MRQDKQLKFGTYDTELEILVSKMQEKEEKLKEVRPYFSYFDSFPLLV